MTESNDLHAPSRSDKEAAPHGERHPYRAFEASSEEQRYLEIRVGFPDPAECPANALLTRIRAEWRMGQSITLEYGDPRNLALMVTIKGENLKPLYRALKEWKVQWIAEFNGEEYAAPTDEAAPFIRSITLHTTRPELSPPVNKRH